MLRHFLFSPYLQWCLVISRMLKPASKRVAFQVRSALQPRIASYRVPLGVLTNFLPLLKLILPPRSETRSRSRRKFWTPSKSRSRSCEASVRLPEKRPPSPSSQQPHKKALQTNVPAKVTLGPSGVQRTPEKKTAMEAPRELSRERTECPGKRGTEGKGNSYCVHGPTTMSVDHLCKYTSGNCSKKDMTITYGVFHPQYSPDLRIHGAYSPQEIFQCHLSSSDARCESFDCISSMKRTYFRPLTQQCYTVDAWNDSHFLRCPSPWTWELRLGASWDPRRTMVFFDTGSLATVVHQARTCPADKLTAVSLQPGKLLTVVVSQRRVERLPSPYKSQCSDYIARGIYPAFEGYLNYDSCMQHCSMKLEHERCGCVRPQHEFAGAVGWTNCHIQESGACFHALNASGAYTRCESRCGLPCEEIVYDVKLAGITEEDGFKHDRKIVRSQLERVRFLSIRREQGRPRSQIQL
ncbi:uncharacterized protein LOC142582501 isoform X3 [Dermacentor variabilis]|uniref:uncharacterized protein LOC142582501 isoform X3 n=1 Tax=Dermacentor variabilis TaxID=34621 RepID=UPI003F5BFABD